MIVSLIIMIVSLIIMTSSFTIVIAQVTDQTVRFSFDKEALKKAILFQGHIYRCVVVFVGVGGGVVGVRGGVVGVGGGVVVGGSDGALVLLLLLYCWC